MKGGGSISFFGGPPFDFNGNGKVDFHEFMTVVEGLKHQQENDNSTDTDYESVYDSADNNENDYSDW